MSNVDKIEWIESDESGVILIDTKLVKDQLKDSENISIFKNHVEWIETTHEDKVKLQDALSVTLNASTNTEDISNLYAAEKALWEMKELGGDKNIVCDGALCDLVTINDSGEISIDTKDKTKSFKVKDVENFDKNQSYIFDFPDIGNISVHRNPIDGQIIIRRTWEIILAKWENESPEIIQSTEESNMTPTSNTSEGGTNTEISNNDSEGTQWENEASLTDLNQQKENLIKEIEELNEEFGVDSEQLAEKEAELEEVENTINNTKEESPEGLENTDSWVSLLDTKLKPFDFVNIEQRDEAIKEQEKVIDDVKKEIKDQEDILSKTDPESTLLVSGIKAVIQVKTEALKKEEDTLEGIKKSTVLSSWPSESITTNESEIPAGEVADAPEETVDTPEEAADTPEAEKTVDYSLTDEEVNAKTAEINEDKTALEEQEAKNSKLDINDASFLGNVEHALYLKAKVSKWTLEIELSKLQDDLKSQEESRDEYLKDFVWVVPPLGGPKLNFDLSIGALQATITEKEEELTQANYEIDTFAPPIKNNPEADAWETTKQNDIKEDKDWTEKKKVSEAISLKTGEITALKKANEALKAENEAIGDIDKITTSLNTLITEQENRAKNKENLENPIKLNSEFKNLDDSQLKTEIDELTEKQTKIKENLGKIWENENQISALEEKITEIEKDEGLTKKVDFISNVLGKDIDEEALRDVLWENYESIMTFISWILKLFGFEANDKGLKAALEEANELTLKEIPKIFEENNKEAKEILWNDSFKIDISEIDKEDTVEDKTNKWATQVLMENLYTLKLPKGRKEEFTEDTLEQWMKELKELTKDNENFKELIEGDTLNAKTFAAFGTLTPDQIQTLRWWPVTKEELFSSIDIVVNIAKDQVDTSMDANDENFQSIIDTLEGDTSLDDLLKDENLKSDIKKFYTPILQKASKEQFLNGHITELSAFHDDKEWLDAHMEKNHGNAVSEMRKYINASSNKTIETTKDTFSTIDTGTLSELSNEKIAIPTILTKLEKFNNYTSEKIWWETWLIDTGKLDKDQKKALKKKMKTINGSMEPNKNKHNKLFTYLEDNNISWVKEADLIGLVAKNPNIKSKPAYTGTPPNTIAYKILKEAGKINNKENKKANKEERKEKRVDNKLKRKTKKENKKNWVATTQKTETKNSPPA